MSDYEDYDDGMRSEVRAFERAGGGGRLAELLSVSLEQYDEGRGSPEDRFLVNVDAFGRRLELTKNDIDNLLTKSQSVDDLKYKNYVAYVLGYVATRGGTKTDKGSMEEAFRRLEELGVDDRMGVARPDVVRYARYWNSRLR